MKVSLEKSSQKVNVSKCSDIARWSNWILDSFNSSNLTCTKILKRKCMVDTVIVNNTNCGSNKKAFKCMQCKKCSKFRNKRDAFNSSNLLSERKRTRKVYKSLKEMVQLTKENSTNEESSGDLSDVFYSFWPGFVTGFACCAGVILLFFTCYKLIISCNKWKNFRRNAELKLYYAKPNKAWQQKITSVIKRNDSKDESERSIIESYVKQSTNKSTKNLVSANQTVGYDDSGYQADEDLNDVVVQGETNDLRLKNVKNLQQRRNIKKRSESKKRLSTRESDDSPPLIRFNV